MKESIPTVIVIDDDEAVRSSLKLLLRSVKLPVTTYASAQEFLPKYAVDQPGCLVVDVRMPGMSGLELQQQLNLRGAMIPVIFITGHGDISMAVEAMRHGAFDFLPKPFRDQDLLDRVQRALEKDAENRRHMAKSDRIRELFECLTPREREVLELVTLGKPMGNGHPVAALVTRREVIERFQTEREFFSTFGGNPVACAAGLAVLDVLEDEDLARNATEVADYLREGLRGVAERHEVIGDIRGTGLLTAVELVQDRVSREPAVGAADAVADAMKDRGVLIGTTGPDGNVLKIRPPLILTREHADLLVNALDQSLTAING